MKTICVKTNNESAIDYLLQNLKELEIDDVYFSCHKFKVYNNIFIHYKGENLKTFLATISNLLVFLVLDIFEDIITKKILANEYFYFDKTEKDQIFSKIQNIAFEDIDSFEVKENILFTIFNNFFADNDILYLKGFLTFRIKKYIIELEKNVNDAVNQYLMEKEYTEFISLLRLYVNSEESKIDLIHLIYHDDEMIVLDEDKNIIKNDLNSLNAKYLSDITFSSADIVLNTLLNLIPNKINIHLIDKDFDDFITTLELIFGNRVNICTDCNICRLYHNLGNLN